LFIGHLALGYAAKRWVPHLSLAALLAASQLADVIWPVLVALGIEHVRIAPGITASTPLEFVSYPYSHSLLTLIVWGALFGWLCAHVRQAPAAAVPRTALVVAALVVSHWVLDFITHIPDMPLYPGGPKFGLGLWNTIAGTRAVEISMFAAGVWIYARATSAHDRIGTWGAWGLAAFLLAGFLASGAPPPSITALWIAALALFALLLGLAWWTDAHRRAARVPNL
jgi:hypothetical protein